MLIGGAVKFQLWTPTKNSPAYLISGTLFTGGGWRGMGNPTSEKWGSPLIEVGATA